MPSRRPPRSRDFLFDLDASLQVAATTFCGLAASNASAPAAASAILFWASCTSISCASARPRRGPRIALRLSMPWRSRTWPQQRSSWPREASRLPRNSNAGVNSGCAARTSLKSAAASAHGLSRCREPRESLSVDTEEGSSSSEDLYALCLVGSAEAGSSAAIVGLRLVLPDSTGPD